MIDAGRQLADVSPDRLRALILGTPSLIERKPCARRHCDAQSRVLLCFIFGKKGFHPEVVPPMAKQGTLAKKTDGPGASLRALRTQKGWTLAEVADRTGLPISTISKLENDKMSLTYDKLTRISSGLNVDIVQLLSADAGGVQSGSRSSGRRSITRAPEGKVIDTGKYFYRYLATDLLNKHFVPITGEVRARSMEEFGELIQHSGEEFMYVLEGAIELHTSLYAPLRLETGDSVYFDSEMPHAYIAAAPGTCRMLSICSASEAQLLAIADHPDVRKHGSEPRATEPKAATAPAKGMRVSRRR
jgi:transcriptional regulator with XRE-family HTH domain